MKTVMHVIGSCALLGAGVLASACASKQQPQADTPQSPSAAAAVPSAPQPAASALAPSSAAAGAASVATPEPAPATGAVGTAGASGESAVAKDELARKQPSKLIMATIQGKSGSKLTGRITLSDKGGVGVKVFIEVEGGKPGDHGTHIHQVGNCTAPDGSSAGDHFNPDDHDHGLPEKEARHLGDLGNLTIDKDGKGTLEIVIPGANLKDIDPHSFIGRALIIHDKKDDGSKPAGNAGKRIGCAEIK